MKVLLACECSGRVRDAFLRRGHDAVSCDLKPSETPGPHIQGDVRALLRNEWDLVIAFPDCTYLANSGARWLYRDLDRWPEMFGAADFFLECLNANAPRVAVENPVMHKWARRLVGRGPDFTVQPWQFGDDFTKRTCFWTRGLPSLRATSRLDGSTAEAAVHRAPPSETRKTDRARFHAGMAEAIADQWGHGVQFDLFGRVA
jgi:hypothetical protein